MPPPSSHTTVRRVPYTAVPAGLRFAVLNACHPISARRYLAASVRYLRPEPADAASAQGGQKISPASPTGSALRRLVRLLRPLLSSAAPSQHLTALVAHLSRGAGRRTSQGKTRDLHAIYLSHLRLHPPSDIGLRVLWPPRPNADASYALPVRQAGTLPAASFRSRIAPDTLAVRLAVPITRACKGLSPPSHRPDTTPTKRCLAAPRAMPGAIG